jgi:PadR family transcriptional regulator, regulatory protein PadR
VDHDSQWLSQIRRGLLELCILNLLARQSMYGYQIVRRLESAPGLVITEGTIYPLLSRLKRQGLIASSLVESPLGPVRRTYVLTPDGKRHLRDINEVWRDIAGALKEFMVPPE